MSVTSIQPQILLFHNLKLFRKFQNLKSIFKHNSFHEAQWAIIRAIIYDKRDCFIIAGTGFGKSLCYQFPPIFMNKIAVVISPLISLMEDQVLALQRKGVKACFLGSMQTEKNINLKKYQVIYLTPEYLDGHENLNTIKDQICLIAIDECHCITVWGSDFRPKFRQLAKFKENFPGVPVLCLTATATEHCQTDIFTSLNLNNPLFIKTDLNRPNLEFSVIRRGEDFVEDVKPFLNDVTAGAAIIYVLRRNETEQYAEALEREGFACKPYHAGLNDETRHQALKDFSEGKLCFIIATIAFGMGIDRADVRTVIHYGSPKNLESYYQEAGRAGRDNQRSKSIIFWEERDFGFHQFWLRNLQESEHKARCENLLTLMRQYLMSNECRRMEILHYFDPTVDQLLIHEACCDNCIKKLHARVPLRKMYRGVDVNGLVNLSTDARILLELVMAYKGKCDEKKSIKFLMGEMPTRNNRNHPLALFARGLPKTEAWWIKLLNILIKRKIIVKRVEVRHILIAGVGEVFDEDDDLEIVDPPEVVVVRNDYLKLTKKGLKLLRRKTLKMFEEPMMVFKFLKLTSREYYIEHDEVKWKLRKVKKVEAKKLTAKKPTANTTELFKFDFNPNLLESTTKRKKGEFNEGASCSKWFKAATNSDEEEQSDEKICDNEDDEYVSNLLWFRKILQKPLKVDLDEFLIYLENYECEEAEDEDQFSQTFDQEQENIPSKSGLKRFCSQSEDFFPPTKILRLSQERAM
jgi:RecQ family ATP-dependent DNA helicase